LNVANVDASNILTGSGFEPTHMVNSIRFGKMMCGSVSLTEADESSKTEVKGQLELTLLNMPLSASASIDAKFSKSLSSCRFKAFCKATGASVSLLTKIEDLKTFIGKWEAVDLQGGRGLGVVSYTLMPLDSLKSIPNMPSYSALVEAQCTRLRCFNYDIIELKGVLSAAGKFYRKTRDMTSLTAINDFSKEVQRKHKLVLTCLSDFQPLSDDDTSTLMDFSRLNFFAANMKVFELVDAAVDVFKAVMDPIAIKRLEDKWIARRKQFTKWISQWPNDVKQNTTGEEETQIMVESVHNLKLNPDPEEVRRMLEAAKTRREAYTGWYKRWGETQQKYGKDLWFEFHDDLTELESAVSESSLDEKA